MYFILGSGRHFMSGPLLKSTRLSKSSAWYYLTKRQSNFCLKSSKLTRCQSKSLWHSWHDCLTVTSPHFHIASLPHFPPKAWRTRPNSMERTKTATMPRVPLQGLSKLMWVDHLTWLQKLVVGCIALRQIGYKHHLVGRFNLPLWKMMEWKSVGMMTWDDDIPYYSDIPYIIPII